MSRYLFMQNLKVFTEQDEEDPFTKETDIIAKLALCLGTNTAQGYVDAPCNAVTTGVLQNIVDCDESILDTTVTPNDSNTNDPRTKDEVDKEGNDMNENELTAVTTPIADSASYVSTAATNDVVKDSSIEEDINDGLFTLSTAPHKH